MNEKPKFVFSIATQLEENRTESQFNSVSTLLFWFCTMQKQFSWNSLKLIVTLCNIEFEFIDTIVFCLFLRIDRRLMSNGTQCTLSTEHVCDIVLNTNEFDLIWQQRKTKFIWNVICLFEICLRKKCIWITCDMFVFSLMHTDINLPLCKTQDCHNDNLPFIHSIGVA